MKTAWVMLLLLLVPGCSEKIVRFDDVSNLPQGYQVGELAREIQGLDSQGVSFQLSDYRGKVVMLDFWGDW